MKPSERYEKLEQHLAEENEVLLDIINIYKKLDAEGQKLGLLSEEDTFASKISWWPLISILGTFSAGKSSFINQYTGHKIQDTGNQAVDDKFTVLCYGNNPEVQTLPGLALDADPRFPFFGMSEQIEEVESGEGKKIDNYLQLKTAKSEALRGKILLDSPGFDADSQRSGTLKITDHVIEMSDLVLVFFDARHPEPGAMRDTLKHLVSTTVDRNDTDKVLFILNQIDTAAKEDNPEEVIGSWQRALAQEGLISGNFYTIYNEEAANKIDDPALAARFKRKKDIDLDKILVRMNKVSTDRAYRIASSIEVLTDSIKLEKLNLLNAAIKTWRRKVLLLDLVTFGSIAAIIIWGGLQMPTVTSSLVDWAVADILNGSILAVMGLITIFGVHFNWRDKVANWEANRLRKDNEEIATALLFNNRFWRGMFHSSPRGWGKRSNAVLDDCVKDSKSAIQKLTDQFANPAGQKKVVASESTVTLTTD